MSIIDRFIINPNRWYDRLPEPGRFFTFFIPFSAGQIVFGLIGFKWFVLWMCFLGFVVIPYRILFFYLYPKEK